MSEATDQYTEIIKERRLIITLLRSLVNAGTIGNMEIPQTQYNWLTKLLEVGEEEGSYYISLEKGSGLDDALSRFPNREISLRFLERDGQSCFFNVKPLVSFSKTISFELPEAVHRSRKRKYSRVEAARGTAVTFFAGFSRKNHRAGVKDYSAGGIAFYVEEIDKDLRLRAGTLVTEIELTIPVGDERTRFFIPKALVRHMKPLFGGRTLYAIEFIELRDETRKNLVDHVSQQGKAPLQKIHK